jgi:hypothetical protein
MDFLTGAILSGFTYDLIKRGLVLSADNLKERLKHWIVPDAELSAITNELNKLKLTDEMSESAIERRINSSAELKLLLENIKPITQGNTIVQQGNGNMLHAGRGDINNTVNNINTDMRQPTYRTEIKNGTKTIYKFDPVTETESVVSVALHA